MLGDSIHYHYNISMKLKEDCNSNYYYNLILDIFDPRIIDTPIETQKYLISVNETNIKQPRIYPYSNTISKNYSLSLSRIILMLYNQVNDISKLDGLSIYI